MKKRLFVLCLLFLVAMHSLAQTGPAGVGTSGSNILWLKADEITGLSSGDDLATWADQSGNTNDLSQPSAAALAPVYITSQINGLPVARFNKANGRIRRTGFTDFPTTEISVFYINRTSDNGDGVFSYNSSSDNDFLLFDSNSLRLYRVGGNFRNSGIAFNDNTFHIVGGSWRSSDGAYEIWDDGIRAFNGTGLQTGTAINAGGSLAIGAEQDSPDGGYAAGQAHNGDFAEVIVFNTFLNQAQKIIVNNYLSTKYALTISNDYYSFDGSHPNDLAGIGREVAGETHTAARSANILQIENPTGLNVNQEYLLFGHDDGDISSWTTTEAPNAGVDIQRLAREWRLDETGDVGDLDFRIETAAFPADPAGLSMYVLLVDADGDFSSGASIYELALSAGTEYLAAGIDIANGDYVSIGIIRPTVSHQIAASSGGENVNASIDIELNFIPTVGQTVEVTTTNGTATAGADYTALTSQVVNIAAGSTTTSYTVLINDDLTVEADETFTATLANPSSGINLGSIPTHTYTIADNDNAVKVFYDLASSSANENSGVITINLSLSAPNPGLTTTVNYNVTGGSATSGVDYSPISGTVSFAAGITTGSFNITLLDDGTFEADETIIIELSNPVNANLDNTVPFSGTGFVTHTFTILNDDTAPIAQFPTSAGSNFESVGSVSIPVELSAVSGADAIIDFTVGGTATGGGVDHDLAPGAVTIPAGSTTANILVNIVNDLIDEGSETIVITLTSATGATIGGSSIFTFTIINSPTFGFTGPGGVGNSNTNLMWLRPDDFGTIADNTPITTWTDNSGNGNDLGQSSGGASTRPDFFNNVVNGFPAIRFNTASGSRLIRASFFTFPTNEISVLFVNNNTDAGDGLFSYASSAGSNDFLIFNSASTQVFVDETQVNSGVGFNGGTWQVGQVEWSTTTGLEVWKDGSQDYTNGSFASGRSITAGGTLAIGAEQDAQDGGYDNAQYFDGDLTEVIVYNTELNEARKLVVQNYLAAKYGVSLVANDLYRQDDVANGDYDYEVAGIGRVDASNQHLDAKGTGLVRINAADDLDDSEFLFWGHDNDELRATNTDVPIGVLRRLERVWRVSELNQSGAAIDVGTVDVSFDLTGLGNVELDELVLLVDADGVFSTGATVISNPLDDGGNFYRFAAVSALSNDVYFTLGTRDQVSTPLPVELTYLDAEVLENGLVAVNWETAEEIDNNFFAIERSADGNDFVDIGLVQGSGTTSAISRYQFIDQEPLAGTNYYRLRQVDFGGAITRTQIVRAFIELVAMPMNVKVWPNPIERGQDLSLSIEQAEGAISEMSLFNSLGQRKMLKLHQKVGQKAIRISTAEMKAGVYVLRVFTTTGQSAAVRFILR
jgi:hypothetical protein